MDLENDAGLNDQRSLTFRLLSCGICSIRCLDSVLSFIIEGILKNISPLPAVMPISSMDLDEKLLLPELLPLLESSLPEIASIVNSMPVIEVGFVRSFDRLVN
jgi:hypothetical protein